MTPERSKTLPLSKKLKRTVSKISFKKNLKSMSSRVPEEMFQLHSGNLSKVRLGCRQYLAKSMSLTLLILSPGKTQWLLFKLEAVFRRKMLLNLMMIKTYLMI